MIRFTVTDAKGAEVGRVETVSDDSLYNMRDQIHASLEPGDYGSRYPLFLNLYEPDECAADRIEELQKELEEIAKAFKAMPPKPLQASMSVWDEIEAGRFTSLYEVYTDAADKPLLGSLIELCQCAAREKRPIEME